MSNNKKHLPGMRGNAPVSGTMRLLEAILSHSEPLRDTTGNEEAQREAKRLDEKEQETRWYDEKRLGTAGPWMRKNQKRKGTMRNNVERRTIERIGRGTIGNN